MSAGSPSPESVPFDPERRVADRRRYNRRTTDTTMSPPYFEVFERIATALEHIAAQLAEGSVAVRLPRNRGQ